MDRVASFDETDSNASNKSRVSSKNESVVSVCFEIEGGSETTTSTAMVGVKEEAMEFSPTELSKPVDLSNNNNVNNNNNSTTTNNNNVGSNIMNSNNNNNGVSRGSGKCSGGGRTEVVASLPTVVNGSGRTLAFSVENILDPNKFTGKTSGSHPTSKSLLSASEFVSTHHHHHHHHQPSSHFRFPFKDIHGRCTFTFFLKGSV